MLEKRLLNTILTELEACPLPCPPTSTRLIVPDITGAIAGVPETKQNPGDFRTLMETTRFLFQQARSLFPLIPGTEMGQHKQVHAARLPPIPRPDGRCCGNISWPVPADRPQTWLREPVRPRHAKAFCRYHKFGCPPGSSPPGRGQRGRRIHGNARPGLIPSSHPGPRFSSAYSGPA